MSRDASARTGHELIDDFDDACGLHEIRTWANATMARFAYRAALVAWLESHDDLVKALEAMMAHSCVAEAAPEDKLPEDHAAESMALRALARARSTKEAGR